MDTTGSIIDKLSILEKRIKVIESERSEVLMERWEDGKEDALTDLYRQRAYLIKEMGDILKKIFAGKRPAMLKKHKLYDREVTVIENPTSFLEAISLLAAQNSIQWDLEDTRREATAKDLPSEVVRIQQLIGESNKKRNDYIDALDEIVQQSVNVLNVNKK